jgi:glutathione S-transferase
MGRYTLYSWPESGNSYKVRLLCALLSVDYDTKDLDFLNLEQQGPAFQAINPKSEVPALVDGSLILTDSSSILTYIAASNPNPGQTKKPSSYWSDDLLEQVGIIEWLAFANGWVQYGVFTARAILSYGGPYNSLGQNTTDAALNKTRLEDAKVRGHKSLAIIDGELAKRDWLVGGRPTIADISNFVYIALVRFDEWLLFFCDMVPHGKILVLIQSNRHQWEIYPWTSIRMCLLGLEELRSCQASLISLVLLIRWSEERASPRRRF